MIRACLVDDQTLVRQGLRSMLDLAPDIEVIAEAEDGLVALEVIPKVKPDIVLLDVRMPRLDGLGVLRRLNAAQALPPTLILTTFDDDELVFDAVKAGAKGYLLKDVCIQVLLDAVRVVAAGGRWLQPAVTERTLRGLESLKRPVTDDLSVAGIGLTVRENEVLRLMAGGYSNREIADALQTTEGTVKSYVSNVLSKLQTRDRIRAVLRALELGLL
ncbi:response regulator transcription factor [Deinococcus sp. QL22]|uniref:response regulator n=1 Tax=Deinococcus sp. QL22 TaxID=2939437 RepID=UPI002017BE3E|nr:response regulator transcription factor [Deinococcus sp. QL22]UQN09319.1 response regulator transcription factor [Deinococcus sp. QL22]